MDNNSSNQPTPSAAHPLDQRIEQWAGQIDTARKESQRRALPSWILLVLCGLVLCPSLAAQRSHPWALAALTVLVAGAVLLIALSRRFRRRAVARLAGEIRQVCRDEGLSADEVVQALLARAKGRLWDEVLSAIDPEAAAVAKIRQQGDDAFRLLSLRPVPALQFQVVQVRGHVNTVILQGESRIDQLAAIAADSLAHEAAVDGLAALAMLGTLYTEIAPAASEPEIRSGQADPAQLDAAVALHQLLSGFDLKPEMAGVIRALAGCRPPSVAEALAQAAQGRLGVGCAIPVAPQSTLPRARGSEFVGACIDYIGRRTHQAHQRQKACELLAGIPDARSLPYLLETWTKALVFPRGIESLSLLGAESHPRLLEALQSGRGPLRFNAAMALGFLRVEAARPELEALLHAGSSPVERAGVCYALTRLGQTGHLPALVGLLEDPDGQVRHAAAIALEYLGEPLPDDVYVRHLDDGSVPVRLSLIRKLEAQGTDNLELAEALIRRFEDGQEEVRPAAVAAAASLPAGLVYDLLAALAAGRPGPGSLCACQALGALGKPEALPLLLGALSKAQSDEDRAAILAALGELGSVEAVGAIAAHLDDKDRESSDGAFWALARISLAHPEAALESLRGRRPHRVKLLFLEALHGDPQAREQLAGMIRPRTYFLTLLEVLEYARILREPSSAGPLRGLLSYRNHPRFPGDRTVSYLALKALVHTELARQA